MSGIAGRARLTSSEAGAGEPPKTRLFAKVTATKLVSIVMVDLDPRALGVLRAFPRAAGFLTRANRRTASAGEDDTVVPVRTTAGLAAQVLLDEVVIAMFRHPRLLPRGVDYAAAAADIEAASVFFEENGWLERPSDYHDDPPAPTDAMSWKHQSAGMRYEHIVYPSEWEPHAGEPGRDRWLSHHSNRTAHAWAVKSAGRASDSWLICVHGFGMGHSPMLDLRSFRAPQLRAQGVNLAFPVLALHGPRASGPVRGEGLMTIDLVDSMHGLAQSAWDIRRLIAWLRAERGARRIGIFGHSLGAHVAALVGALEDDVQCVICGIPEVDIPDMFRRHSPPEIERRAYQEGVLGPAADSVHKVVSPLALECRVPFEGRYIFAGLGDRMATFGHARKLWLHWGRPPLATYHGGHVGFFWSATVRRFVEDALRSCGLLRTAPPPDVTGDETRGRPSATVAQSAAGPAEESGVQSA